MSGQDDFRTSLKAIMAAKREELGEPPTPEELLAYRDGRLDLVERQRMEARIAVHPDAARALADLAAFPNVEPAPGTPELTDEEIGARWQSFRRRLPELPKPEPVKEEESPAPATVVPIGAHRRPFGLPLAAAATVALTAGLAGGFLIGRASHDVSESYVNVHIAELTPVTEEGERSAPAPVEMPERSEELMLILAAEEGEAFPDYEAEIVDPNGVPVWTRMGLRPTSLGNFHLSFRRGALESGMYRIHLYGRDGERRTRVATYELRLR
ncbi:MAG TPA: hypothetical protein VF756_26835 [Thermoanaerobaculia bacterium]